MTSTVQRSFSGGELAPELYARTDQVKYATGLRVCRNFQVMKHGGVENRAGTEFVNAALNANKTALLVPWIFNADQTYVIEFADLVVRFIQNGAYVLDGAGPALYELVSPFAESELRALTFSQSADVLTIAHPDHILQELIRHANDDWEFRSEDFSPNIDAPTGFGGSGGNVKLNVTYFYCVTAVKDETGEESLIAGVVTMDELEPTADAPITITWDAVTGAAYYRVYRQQALADGDFGFLGTSPSLSFADVGIFTDPAQHPPVARTPLAGAGNRAGAVGNYQQRRILGASTNAPERVYATRIGDPRNLRMSSPLRDDDPVTFDMMGKVVNYVKHFLDLGRLVIFTSAGEYVADGDQAGILTPAQVNLRRLSANGCAQLAPLEVDSTALYVQARGSIIRDLAQNAITGTLGNDLTIFSTHLFKGFTIVDWAYQQNPHSIVWVVRSDGVLLGLTYIKEQQVWAWHRHDTAGAVENVCVVPEGDFDRLYLLVKRTIDGATVRYVERMSLREFDDVRDANFTDASLAYDGRDYGAGTSTTVVLSDGSTWENDETLTLTANHAVFSAGDVGNQIILHGDDGAQVRFTIVTYNSMTVVHGHPEKTVPASIRATTIALWDRAVDQVAGLDHLEGASVSVWADAYVVASPNNSAYDPLVVAGGSITLPRPYAMIRVGLPITADFQTLDLDNAEGPSRKTKKQNISRVYLSVIAARGIFAGADAPGHDTVDEFLEGLGIYAGAEVPDDDVDPLDGLQEIQMRNTEGYDEPVQLATGTLSVNIQSSWNSNGRIFVRQVDPIPLSILAAIPQGKMPQAG